MFNSVILDVAVGLIFTFLSVSLAAGAAVEAVSSFFKLRAKTLKSGIMDLLNDQDFNGLAAKLYGHALINPRGPGLPPPAAAQPNAAPAVAPAAPVPLTAQAVAAISTKLPAYIESGQFAKALMEVLSIGRDAAGALPTVDQLQTTIDQAVPASQNPQLNQLLHGIVLRTQGDLAAIRLELSTWFDGAMDRLSGAYKRHTQVFTFLAAFVICVIINADSVRVAQRVWAQPTIVTSLKPGATPLATVDQAVTLPFGWPDGKFLTFYGAKGAELPLSLGVFGSAFLGWLITSLASLFGAPFWFDTLQQVTRLKGTGPSPAEKKDDTAAAA
jgi:hypothetical protein